MLSRFNAVFKTVACLSTLFWAIWINVFRLYCIDSSEALATTSRTDGRSKASEISVRFYKIPCFTSLKKKPSLRSSPYELENWHLNPFHIQIHINIILPPTPSSSRIKSRTGYMFSPSYLYDLLFGYNFWREAPIVKYYVIFFFSCLLPRLLSLHTLRFR